MRGKVLEGVTFCILPYIDWANFINSNYLALQLVRKKKTYYDVKHCMHKISTNYFNSLINLLKLSNPFFTWTKIKPYFDRCIHFFANHLFKWSANLKLFKKLCVKKIVQNIKGCVSYYVTPSKMTSV